MSTRQPGTQQCFISHSYEDVAALQACLRRRLPRGSKPFVFPRISVTPDQAVSDSLVDTIRDCAGLVYLKTALSLKSFWVGFERNIAARLGRPVYAFSPSRPIFAFTHDRSPPADPIVSILFNLCIREDIERIKTIREVVWDRYRFEIRGDQWRRLDNDERQMIDSIEGLHRKLDAGGVVLLFLSIASVCSGYHDYADPFTYRRAGKDLETPIGHAGEKFAHLDRDRTLVVWLDQPDTPRIEAALQRLPQQPWAPYVELVRRALADPNKLVVGRADARLDLNHLDTMLARCFWAALKGDAPLAASFRKSLAGRETEGVVSP